MQTDFDDNSLHKLSSKQTTFLVVTGIPLWVIVCLSIACVFFFVETVEYNKDITNAINTYNKSSSTFFNYFRSNGNQIITDCFIFDGHQFTVTAPFVLSSNAKQKIQFENGLKLPGMVITPTEVDLSGSILFNNNLYGTYQYRFETSLIQSSMNSHFIGQPGYTEIGFRTSTQNTQCISSSPVGANDNPFPGVYVAPGSSPNTFKLCLCLANWVRRDESATAGTPLALSLQGTGQYDTPGEYCIPLSTL